MGNSTIERLAVVRKISFSNDPTGRPKSSTSSYELINHSRCANQATVQYSCRRFWYCRWTVVLLAMLLLIPAGAHAQQKLILAVGAEGSEEYGKQFEVWAANWKAAIETVDKNKPELTAIGLQGNSSSDFDLLKAAIGSTNESTQELWIVLIGHGTDDRESAKFNLRGPDVSAAQLNEWLAPLSCRVIVINCTSASGSFINRLQGQNRIVVTATKSGAQQNFARFGGYLSQAIADPTFDLDKDQQTSLLEAFLAASSQSQEFYVQETRLATELAMVDDNGDGLGTPADWFQGTRVIRKSKKGEPDGLSANQVFLVRGGEEAKLSETQRVERDGLERELEKLRSAKSTMTEETYFQSLEPVLLKLAKLYHSVSDSGE